MRKASAVRSVGHGKLAAHRERALKKMPPSKYAVSLGISPQRIGMILSDKAPMPTLPEALKLQDKAKISPKAWITAA
jgi:hypothetical protein